MAFWDSCEGLKELHHAATEAVSYANLFFSSINISCQSKNNNMLDSKRLVPPSQENTAGMNNRLPGNYKIRGVP